ncbi:MAG: lipid II flippase MurJ [Opitutaceae bacterium]
MLRSSVIVTLFAFGGSVATLLNQLLLAHFFGAGAEMDSYLIAISQPTVLSGLFSGMLSYQVVPALVRAERRMGSASSLLRSLVLGVGCGTTVLALLCVLFAEQLVTSLYGTLEPSQVELAVQLTRIAWLWLPLAVTSAIYTAGLHLKLQFSAATSIASFPIVGAALGCLVGQSRYGISAAAVGQLVGYAVMLVWLRLKFGTEGRGWDWKGLRELGQQTPLALAAVLVFVVYPVSDAFWASRVGPAAVSYLGYAQRLVVGLASLAIVGATTVMFPRLARLGGAGAIDHLKLDLARGLRVILLSVCPVAVILAVAALPSLQLLFQRGSFRFEDAQAVADILPGMLCGMVAMSCMGIMFKAFFALKRIGTAATVSFGGSLLYFALSGILGGTSGLDGISASYAVSWWVVLGVSIAFLWGRPWRNLVNGETVLFLLSTGAALFVALAITWVGCIFLPRISADNIAARFIGLGSVAIAALTGYAAVGYLIGIPEMRFAFHRGAEKLKGLR